ncbi:MAG: hypothetical protein COA43_07085 [Robiginitomaculum sp.]|nr:MAG: hypothetical protein COA43_07085 [Robiginitomaculum sp.]
MQSTYTPFQDYINQTLNGESRWWSWCIGIWFAILIWLCGQIILGFGILLVSSLTDTEIFSAMTSEGSAPPPTNSNLMALYALLSISPIIPVSLWFTRENLKSKLAKQIAIALSGFIVIGSSAAFIHANMNTPDGSTDFVTHLILSHPLHYALILLAFPVLIAGLWIVQTQIHKRTFLSLLTSASKFRWKRMGFAMIVVWAVMGIGNYITHITGLSPAKFVFDPSRFWIYLPVTLLFIPLQSATEEIALRGYLNQGLGRFIKNPWIIFFLTSAAFASLHLGNPEVLESTKDTSLLLAISGYFFFGFFACVLTYIDGGLESAIGMHAANNIFAASMMGYDNSALPTPTIFKVELNTSLDSVTVLISLSIVCFIMYKTRKPYSLAQNN